MLLLILLTLSIIVIRNIHKYRGKFPSENLEKIAIYLDIVVAFIYIILTAIDSLPLASGLAVPAELIWGVLSTLIVSVIGTVVVRFRQRSYVERISGIMAYIFFPKGTPEENKTLDYSKKNFRKRLLVSFRKKPPQAYYLHAAGTSYGWKLINKYLDLWTSVEDSDIDSDQSTAKWCQKQRYELHPWGATKVELKEMTTDLNSDLLSELKKRKQEGKLRDFRIIFLCPWYKFRSSGEWANKRVMIKRSTNEAFDAPVHVIELVINEILDHTTKVKWPWQTIKKWCKRNGNITYKDWRYSEEQLAEETK